MSAPERRKAATHHAPTARRARLHVVRDAPAGGEHGEERDGEKDDPRVDELGRVLADYVVVDERVAHHASRKPLERLRLPERGGYDAALAVDRLDLQDVRKLFLHLAKRGYRAAHAEERGHEVYCYEGDGSLRPQRSRELEAGHF